MQIACEAYPTYLNAYSEKYKDSMILTRKNGILELRFHTDGGPMMWSAGHQHGFLAACEDIQRDVENQVLIITGTGDEFNNKLMPFDHQANRISLGSKIDGFQTIDGWYRIVTRMIYTQLALQIPTIAAINGPLICHPEIPLMCDIVIASDNTYFKEAHFAGPLGIPVGDGAFAIWRELLGYNRAKYMTLTGEKLNANEALRLGVVSELLPLDKLNARAWELAEYLMTKPKYCRNFTHQIINRRWRTVMSDEIEFSMAHESAGAMADYHGGELKLE